MAGLPDETVAALGGFMLGGAAERVPVLRDMATFDSAGVSGEKA